MFCLNKHCKTEIVCVEMSAFCSFRKNINWLIFVVSLTLFIESFLWNFIFSFQPIYLWDFGVKWRAMLNCSDVDDCKDYRYDRFSNIAAFSCLVFTAGYLMQLIVFLLARHIPYTTATSTVVMFIGTLLVVGAFAALLAFNASVFKFSISRVLHGAGSTLVIGSGLSRLSIAIKDDKTRQIAFSFTTLGMTAGIVAGPVLGGIVYTIKSDVILMVLIYGPILIEIIIQPTIMGCDKETKEVEPPSPKWSLILHREVFIGLISNILTTACIVVVNITIPLWILHFDVSIHPWLVGLIFLPGALGNTLTSFLSSCISSRIGQCSAITASLASIALSLFSMPYIHRFSLNLYFLPMACIGLGQGFISSLIVQMLGKHLSNTESEPESTFFLFIEVAEKLGCVLGPGLCAILLLFVRFEILMIVFASLLSVVIPFQLFLSQSSMNPQGESEKLLQRSSLSDT